MGLTDIYYPISHTHTHTHTRTHTRFFLPFNGLFQDIYLPSFPLNLFLFLFSPSRQSDSPFFFYTDLPISLSVCMFVCLSVCLSVYFFFSACLSVIVRSFVSVNVSLCLICLSLS